MNALLEAYLAIFKAFPSKETFSKAQKKARYNLMLEWKKIARSPFQPLMS